LISKIIAVVLFYAMKKIVLLFSFLLFITVFPNSYAFDGPLQVKNQFPLFLSVNTPYLETASLQNSFTASLSHSSIYLVEHSSEWDMGLDMEMTGLRCFSHWAKGTIPATQASNFP